MKESSGPVAASAKAPTRAPAPVTSSAAAKPAARLTDVGNQQMLWALGIQRKCACADCDCEDEETISRKGDGHATSKAAEGVRSEMRCSHSELLAGAIRQEYERSFRADLGGVRLHTDAAAARAASGINAVAFAQGNDIYFNRGGFNPANRAGRELLAHELTHVVQQRRAPHTPAPYRPFVSYRSDPAELEADRVAKAIVGGGHPGPIGQTPGARLHRQGPDAAFCVAPPVTHGTFELDPDLPDVAIPTAMTAHVRVSQPTTSGGRGLFRDRFVEIVRPVKSATRLTAYAVPMAMVTPADECTGDLMSRPLAAGDHAQTASGPITITHVEGDMVFTAQPNPDTVGAGSVVFIETDAGTVVIDAGLQVSGSQYKQALGAELGRQIGERTQGQAVGEAIIATVTADGPSLPFITTVGFRSVRATQDLYDDGTVAAVLAAHEEYRRWYEKTLRERLISERAEWESTQPIAPNQGVRDQIWEKHLAATIAEAMRREVAPALARATEAEGVMKTGEPAEPAQVDFAEGEIPDVSETQWEAADDQFVFIYGGGQLAMFSSRGLVMRPATTTAPKTVAVPAPTEVPNLLRSGQLGLRPAGARPVTPWMVLQTIGKQSHVVVRTNIGLAMIVDAGGPRAIAARKFAAVSSRLGGVTAETVLVTHEHTDHVRQLLDVIEKRSIAPDKLVLSESWPEVVEALRSTSNSRLVALGYGAEWSGPRIAMSAEPVTQARIRSGAVDVDIIGLSEAHRDYAAAKAREAAGGPEPASSAADRASLLYVFGNESSPNRTLFLGDFRGENIVELHGHLGADRFNTALRNVRTVVGAGHHFSHAAGRNVGDVRGLELLVEGTLVQNGELTILVQSHENFSFKGGVTLAGPEGALLRYFVRQGVRVVFVGAGKGGAEVSSTGGVSTYGSGAQIIAGEPRVVEMYRRLDILREARKTVVDSAKFGPAALDMEGRSATDIRAGLDADISRLEGLARELRGQAGADLLDLRGPEAERGTSRARVAERQAYRDANTTAGRTADQILADMETKGPAEQALKEPVLQRLRLAVATGRSIALDVEFAHTPLDVATALERLPAAQRSALAQQYRELAEIAGRLDRGLVPPAQQLDVLSRAMVLRDGLTRAHDAAGAADQAAFKAELARINDVIARLEAGTMKHVEIGRDVSGKPTRTEYIRMRQANAVSRTFHQAGQVMGAMMVLHSVSELGAVADDAARGQLTLPEGALRVAHAAYGMNIGVRLARTTFRQVTAGTAKGVGFWEFALLAVIEVGAVALAEHETTEARNAAILGTAIHSSVNLACMYAGGVVMGWGAKLQHPYARAAGMGLGLAIMFAGESILEFLGLDDNIQRWTSFPPSEVTEVHQEIGKALREYRILVGTRQLAARSDAEITGLGLSDPSRVRTLAASTEKSAELGAYSKEKDITKLFEAAYVRARSSWVGLQMLDEQAEEFMRLRQMAMSGRDDPGRAELDARWRALDASLDLSGADENTIRSMEQWSNIDEKFSEARGHFSASSIEYPKLFESMEELQLMMDNARYRIDSPTHVRQQGALRPRAMIQPGSAAFSVYEGLLNVRETKLASLQADLMRANTGSADSRLNDLAMDPETTLTRLRAIRQNYDGLVTAAAAENPLLGLTATWDDLAVLARTAVAAYRIHGQTFERLRLSELTLQSAGRQLETSLTVASSPPPEVLRRMARTEIDSIPNAIIARRKIHGLVFPHELDTVLEERGVEEDAILAARMDTAFPRAGTSPTAKAPPPTEMEIEALHAGDLKSVGGRTTTTERQLGYVRQTVAPGRVHKEGDPIPSPMDYVTGDAKRVWDLMSRAIEYREFGKLERSYRVVDFEWNNTYPSRTVKAGRTPIVAILNKTHAGCNCEYCFCGPLYYMRVVAVNADAVAELGIEPVYVAGYTKLTQEMIDQQLGTAAPP